MWPDEKESLDDDDDGSAGFGASSGAGVDEGGPATSTGAGTTALEAAVAATAAAECDGISGETNNRREGGMGPAGGLREEWELMTTEEKVSFWF